MEEKKKQLFELLSSLEWTCDTSHPDREYIEKEFESVWSFVTKLVEKVERECNKGKLKIERGQGSREYRLVCAMCNGDKSEFCRFCEGMGSHMITFN